MLNLPDIWRMNQLIHLKQRYWNHLWNLCQPFKNGENDELTYNNPFNSISSGSLIVMIADVIAILTANNNFIHIEIHCWCACGCVATLISYGSRSFFSYDPCGSSHTFFIVFKLDDSDGIWFRLIYATDNLI